MALLGKNGSSGRATTGTTQRDGDDPVAAGLNGSFREEVAEAYGHSPLVCITFHYDVSRIRYLSQTVAALCSYFVDSMDIVILTNTDNLENINRISGSFPTILGNKRCQFLTATTLTDPFVLTWTHKIVMKTRFFTESSPYSHFIYIEDDIALSFENYCYFLHYRRLLAPYGLVPSFLRIEYDFDGDTWNHTDNPVQVSVPTRPRVQVDGLDFVNMPNPYTGFFIMDRDLATEHHTSRSFDVNQSIEVCPSWPIRERANMGICFDAIPKGFDSRYVVPVTLDRQTLPFCCVRHLPNNYANDPTSIYGRLSLTQLFV